VPGSCTTHKRAWGIPQGVPVGVDVAELYMGVLGQAGERLSPWGGCVTEAYRYMCTWSAKTGGS